jgi:hypothetical protein
MWIVKLLKIVGVHLARLLKYFALRESCIGMQYGLKESKGHPI